MNNKTQDLTNKELRNFGLLTGVIFILLFVLLPWLIKGNLHVWPFWIAGALWFIAVPAPSLLRPVYRLWMKFGHIMGWINTRLILGIMYYLIIVPIGLVMKLLGKDPMMLRVDKTAETYRIMSEKKDKKHVERVF